MLWTSRRARVAIIGSGSLAGWICRGLATIGDLDIQVSVVARDIGKATAVCRTARQLASSCSNSVVFQPACCRLTSVGDVARTLTRLRLDCVVLCASIQSPWESRTAPSSWTALLSTAGFGVALPLHTHLARIVGAAVPSGVVFLNACYPDAVNPVLASLHIPVMAGVGNAGSLAATLRTKLRLPDQQRLRVLAHHAHLSPPSGDLPEAEVWLDDRPVADVGTLLAEHRATDRKELNRITGGATAEVLSALLAGFDIDTNLPGPLGLPGGYPVRIRDGELALRLPPGVSKADAIAFNQRVSLADGVVVEQDRVVFSATADAAMRKLAPGFAGGYHIADLDTVSAAFCRLRDLLRTQDTVTPLPAGH